MRKLLLTIPICLMFLIIFSSFASAIKIVVDAGHGGTDPGAIGINGLYEKDLNIDIALKLKDELQKRGYTVVLTREDDRFISLKDRVHFTIQQSADLFISIHGNSYPNSQGKGTLVLYYDNRFPQTNYPASKQMESLTPISKSFAQQVLHSFINKLDTVNQGLVPSSAFVVRNGHIPSILIETAFLSNPEDAAILADSNVRTRMAEAIAEGIQAFRPAKLSDIHGHWAEVEILQLIEAGFIHQDTVFYYPERYLTRAELLTFLDRIYPFVGLPNDYVAPIFDDLSNKHWAYPTLLKAIAAGYIQGYDNGTIQPDQAVSRAEAAKLIHSFVDNTTVNESAGSSFTDVPEGAWYSNAITHLKEIGILTGKTPTLFEPDSAITRAEMAVILGRLIEKKPLNVN